MIDKIEIKETLSDAIISCQDVLEQINELQRKYAEIEGQLEDELWSGEANDKCKNIQAAICKYTAEIQPLCQELQEHIILLRNNAEDFHSVSENISMIKTI